MIPKGLSSPTLVGYQTQGGEENVMPGGKSDVKKKGGHFAT